MLPISMIHYSLVHHKEENRIQISFEKNDAWNERIKKYPGARWSRSLRSWLIPDTEENRKKCGLPLDVATKVKMIKQTSKEALIYISPCNKEAMRKFLQTLQLKAY